MRLRGRWVSPTIRVLGQAPAAEDYLLAADATELTLGALGPYAVLDFAAAP